MKLGNRKLHGTAYLESDHVLFRGDERVKILLKEVTTVRVADGVLVLDRVDGAVEIELGKAAEKWAARIMNPPSRADKLSVKPGARVRLVGAFDQDFVRELGTTEFAENDLDLVFVAAEKTPELASLAKWEKDLKLDGGIWVVYPKGVKTIREIDVIEAGRAAGLKDVKVAAFSPTHTALKFVIPVAARPYRAVRSK